MSNHSKTMRYGQTITETRPTPRMFSLHKLPAGREVQTSSWILSSTATGRTTIVDPSAGRNVTIAVMGTTGSGKTTFTNLASGSNFLVGAGLSSCTDAVQVSQPFELDDRLVTLIDTPGFDDSETDILRIISEHLASEYRNAKKLAGVIYIHRISDFRMGGTSTRNFRLFRQLCGEATLKNVVIVTNMWGEVEKEIGEAREAELAEKDKLFKPVLDRGAQMLRHENTKNSAHNIVRQIIQNHPVTLQIQHEMVEEKKAVLQTVAADELNREILLQTRQYRNEMRALKEEMGEAIRVKDQQRKQEVELRVLGLQAEMSKILADAECEKSAHREKRWKFEQQMQLLGENARMEREEAREEYNRQMEEIKRLQEAGEDSEGKRQELREMMR